MNAQQQAHARIPKLSASCLAPRMLAAERTVGAVHNTRSPFVAFDPTDRMCWMAHELLRMDPQLRDTLRC